MGPNCSGVRVLPEPSPSVARPSVSMFVSAGLHSTSGSGIKECLRMLGRVGLQMQQPAHRSAAKLICTS